MTYPATLTIAYGELQFDPTDRTPRSLLGTGATADVFRGQWNLAPTAIKKFNVTRLPERDQQHFIQELNTMVTLQHRNVVQLYGYCVEPSYCLVMELVDQGTLYDRLGSVQAISWPQRYQWGIQTGAGLHYLHTRTPPIVHRDLKSPNILLDGAGIAKIADFGLAMEIIRTTMSTQGQRPAAVAPPTAVGTLCWMAPESLGIDREPIYNVKSDIYAYGVVLWEIGSREKPFKGIRDAAIPGRIVAGGRPTMPPAPDCPQDLTLLITRIWDGTPSARPDVPTIVQELRRAYDQLVTQLPSAQQQRWRAAEVEVRELDSAMAQLSTAVPLSAPSVGSLLSAPPTIVASVAAMVAPTITPAPNPALQTQVNQLILHVARGEQDAAEAMARSNPNLLLYKGKVTDYSNRTFKSITAFQYALWAYDWYMWEMLRRYLPQPAAKEQLHDLEHNGTEHAKHYDTNELLQALQTYVHNLDRLYDVSSEGKFECLWVKGVGGAQCRVPTHVANEYCRPGRPFKPTPSFTEPALPRVLIYDKKYNWFPLDGSLGTVWACQRGVHAVNTDREGDSECGYCEGNCKRRCDAGLFPVDIDISALTALFETRTTQYATLRQRLGE